MVLVIVALLVGLAGPAWAQQEKPEIGLVTWLHGNATDCGLIESEVTSLATVAVRASGLQVASRIPFLHIDIFALLEHAKSGRVTGCSTALRVSVFTIGVPRLEEPIRSRDGDGRLILCRKDILMSAPQSEMGTYALGELDKQIKLCLADLDY